MSANASDNGAGKPRLHTARSFPRMDSPDTSPFVRSRAKTVQSVAIPELVDAEALPLPLSTPDEERVGSPDLFEKPGSSDLGDDGQQGEEISVLSRGSQGYTEELPIELASMTDRYSNTLPLPMFVNGSLISSLVDSSTRLLPRYTPLPPRSRRYRVASRSFTSERNHT